MLEITLPWLIGAFVVSLLLNTWRLLIGPGVPDRILALDTLYINACALLVVMGIWFDTPLYFEAALIIGMLGFIGTVVVSMFVLSRSVAE